MNGTVIVAANVAAHVALVWCLAASCVDRPEQLRPASRLWRTASAALWRGWWPAYLTYIGWVALWATWWLRGEQVNPAELAVYMVFGFGFGIFLALRPYRHHVQLEMAERKQRDRHG